MKPQPTPITDEVVDGPAIVTPLHRQDRPATDNNMRPVTGTSAWRKLTPLQATYAKDQLAGGSNRYTAADRYAAGQRYADLVDASERGGKDSTQALNISRSSTLGSNNDGQQRAWDELICIQSHLGERDRKIIQRVCGEGAWPSEAIREVCGDYKHTIAARFREALDSLADAMETARRNPRSFNMQRRA